ncbi:MAG: SDR family oxidoreductase [Dehalococcoidia bacterium]|nr:SDR family oxidoreductase [Dehalococcoidia bacterium]
MGRALKGRVAVITGASRGIGQAIAVRFAAEGAKVALIGRDEAGRRKDLAGTLEEGLQRIAALGGAAIPVRADIGDLNYDKRDIVRQIIDAFGSSPDILFHCAAAPREWGADSRIPFAEMTADWFFRSVTVNVWGGWDLARAVIPGMREQGAGWITMISSSQAFPRPHPGRELGNYRRVGGGSLYGGTKAFIDRICTGAAQDLYADNIAVNALAPNGGIVTPNALSVGSPPQGSEPMETFVEAALALSSGDPKVLTSRVIQSLPLLYELNRPVYTLDGASLFDGWQPNHDDQRRFMKSYIGH